MLYRTMSRAEDKLSILGFGCMRFPTIDGDKIDEKKAIKMLHYAIDNGVNYIDTAYPYHNGYSELLVAKALKDGYREKVKLATKLPSWLIQTRADMDKYLNEQLKRLETDYIDYYLLHALNKTDWKKLKQLGVLEFLDISLKSGKIRYAGFSFHDDIELFKEVVDSYEWTFCQIQYNYLDEEYQAGKEGLKYAAKKGIGVIVMEPLRGGKLTNNIPKEVEKIWNKSDIKRTPAEWALQWIWNHPEVTIVLSGMSNMHQVKENICLASSQYAHENSLKDEEIELVNEVKAIYKSKIKINCTNCRYCMPCPNGVNIPECFNEYNNLSIFGDFKSSKASYNALLKEEERASKCISCGKCEVACPQNIPIIEKLMEIAKVFEKS
ncbi:aldo/keto reductase [Clostridium aestuarii]|uniref:Aldo/keto reductase n=1 Tax=Clostridium aestuarii TaxID=338193 RepID=A0ABT4D1I6_9CLOT|nr:aldo/keto reductase [Clostridium aestuarii]MCY6485091.1 aldo/keto reductase [Clostridium aestuarii]